MEILKQRINFAYITLYKNYCPLVPTIVEEPTFLKNQMVFKTRNKLSPVNMDLNTIFGYFRIGPNNKKTKTKFYYSDEVSNLTMVCANQKNNGVFFTTNDKHIRRHYMNPFAEITTNIIERVIRKTEDKLILKFYHRERTRTFNSKYFKTRTKIYTLSYSFKNGDITCGISNTIPNKKSIRYRKNTFTELYNILNTDLFKFRDIRGGQDVIKSELNNRVFQETFLENLGEGKEIINNLISPHDDSNMTDEIKQKIMELSVDFLVKHKKIKTPNNYFNLLVEEYPGENFLKKNNRKLILSILDSYGVKSKIVNKIVHENPILSIPDFASFCHLFGPNYHKFITLLTQKELNLFNKENDKTKYHGFCPPKERIKLVRDFNVLSDDEKMNIIKVLKTMDISRRLKFQSLFKDHISMLEKLKEFYPDMKFRATNITDFNEEHSEFSKLVTLIKKGWMWEYVYDNRMIRNVEDKIQIEHDGNTYEFKPVILKREEEYSEEGTYMHHCVGTYASKTTSMIISLRDVNGSDRVTCEVEKKTGDYIQERYFCNGVPPEQFKPALLILSKRIKKFSKQRMLDHLEIKKSKIVINGVEINVKEEQNFIFDQQILNFGF